MTGWWDRQIKDPDWSSRREIGRWGEDKAARYLENKGYKIIARHWTHRIGELDIVAAKDGRVVFVEVRTKTSLRYGMPEESVGAWKKERLCRTANVYMLKHKIGNMPYQIDLIAIVHNLAINQTTIRHFENVLSGR